MSDIHAQIQALEPTDDNTDVLELYVRLVRPMDVGSALDSDEVGDALNTALSAVAVGAEVPVLAFDVAESKVIIRGMDRQAAVTVSRSLADFTPSAS